MFLSVSSLKSSLSPRTSFGNLPSLKGEQLLSTFEKDKENDYQNQDINIRCFESQKQLRSGLLKTSSIQRFESQESLPNLPKQRLSFQKRVEDQDRVNRFFKKTQNSRMNLVRSVDGISSRNCYNLDGKKAKYIVLESEQHENKEYCSKCSIMLLQKGYQICEINETANQQQKSSSRSELQELTVKLNRIQSDIKSQLSNLEHNYFFSTIESSKTQIQQTYNKIVQLILRMKQDDLKQLKSAKQDILKQTQSQKKILLLNTKTIDNIKQTLFVMSKRLPNVGENEYKQNVREALRVIESNRKYESLEFSIKQENEDKTIERVIDEVKGKLLRVVEFSFDNIKKGVVEECDQSLGGLEESFREIFSCYRAKNRIDK